MHRIDNCSLRERSRVGVSFLGAIVYLLLRVAVSEQENNCEKWILLKKNIMLGEPRSEHNNMEYPLYSKISLQLLFGIEKEDKEDFT